MPDETKPPIRPLLSVVAAIGLVVTVFSQEVFLRAYKPPLLAVIVIFVKP